MGRNEVFTTDAVAELAGYLTCPRRAQQDILVGQGYHRGKNGKGGIGKIIVSVQKKRLRRVTGQKAVMYRFPSQRSNMGVPIALNPQYIDMLYKMRSEMLFGQEVQNP